MTQIATHNGHFHTDDLMAVAVLLLKFPNADVVRTRDEKVIEAADIVVDVGQIYDPAKMRFDHHQLGGAGKRDNGIPYASFGLVWKEFGVELMGGVEEARIFEERLVMPIDAIDNGVEIFKLNFENVSPYPIWEYLNGFQEGHEKLEELDADFMSALLVANDLLQKEIKQSRKRAGDFKKVMEIYENSARKDLIIIDDMNISWKRALVPSEAKMIIFPRPDGKWNARAIPTGVESFELKKPFPASWAGLNTDKLIRVSGVDDAFFCHKDLFLCVAQSREGAVKLADIALNS